MDIDPDLQLVERCQAGDISAFDGIVQRHRDRIYRLVYRMLRDTSSADDVAQDIFLKVYHQIGKFQHRASFSTWLTRIAVNHCINHLRSQKRYRFFSAGVFFHRDRGHPSDEPHEEVERTEKCEKVYQAISSLSPKRKAVIVLHYFEDYPCAEIASILDCSIGTVKSRLFYARRDLKKQLEPYIMDGIDTKSEIGGEGYEVLKM